MPGAVGISWLALPRSKPIALPTFTTYPTALFRRYLPCRCLHQQTLRTLSPATILNSKLGTRSVKTSSITHKRGVNDRRSGPGYKSGGGNGGYSRGKPLYDRGSNTPSGRLSGNSGSSEIPVYRPRRPAYVKAHSVSGSQMVQAIESSREGAALSTPEDGDRGSVTDPFGNKGADPFANKLEAAIEASLRTTGQSQWSNRADSRHDRANTYPAAETQIPDIQAQYLVGYARWESVKAQDVEIKSKLSYHCASRMFTLWMRQVSL
jgi:hypothetical protein